MVIFMACQSAPIPSETDRAPLTASAPASTHLVSPGNNTSFPSPGGSNNDTPDLGEAEADPDAVASFGNVACATLDLPANVGEINTNLDLEAALLELSFVRNGEDVHIRVSLFDPMCLAHPLVGQTIENDLADAAENLATECADWRARLNTGSLSIGGQQVDPDAVRAFIERWCH